MNVKKTSRTEIKGKYVVGEILDTYEPDDFATIQRFISDFKKTVYGDINAKYLIEDVEKYLQKRK